MAIRQWHSVPMIMDEVELLSPSAHMGDVQGLPRLRIEGGIFGIRRWAHGSKLSLGHRIPTGKQRHIDSMTHQPGAEESNLPFSRAIMPGRYAPDDRGQQGNAHTISFRCNDSRIRELQLKPHIMNKKRLV